MRRENECLLDVLSGSPRLSKFLVRPGGRTGQSVQLLDDMVSNVDRFRTKDERLNTLQNC